nr:hypothetical protein [Ignavibacteriaceae bacterium]
LLNPFISYFGDNTDFGYLTYGISSDLGVTSFLSLGLQGSIGKLSSPYTTVDLNTWKGSLYIRPLSPFLIGLSYGEQAFLSPKKTYPLYEAFIRANEEKHFHAQVTYLQQEAATMLYSALLVYPFGSLSDRLRVEIIKAEGWYITSGKYRVSGAYTYLMISDGNRGANTEVRIGRYFYPELLAGYELYSTIYARKSIFYYSPQSFLSHSIFADWNFYKDEQFDISAGGRFGFIPESAYWLREGYVQAVYSPLENLRINARGQLGSTARETIGYSSRSYSISVFWML